MKPFNLLKCMGRSDVKHVKDNCVNVLEIRLESNKTEVLGYCLTNQFVFLFSFL